MTTAVQITDTAAGLADVIDRLAREPRVSIDTESNSFHRFPERICLIQIATESESWVIDPLPLSRDDAAPLARLLADRSIEKVMHAASNDIRIFDREWGFPSANVFDTSTAALFCGMERVGLDNVLHENLGVVITKNKNLQRADWTLRPLSEEGLRYAVNDVVHLIRLRDVLAGKLAGLGRTGWVDEEFKRLEDIRFRPPDPPEVAFLATRGSRDLNARGLAILREVYLFRHAEGLRRGIPPFKILSDRVLVYLATNPATALSNVPEITPSVLRRVGSGLAQALEKGIHASPLQRPRRNNGADTRRTPAHVDRLKALKAWRIARGDELNLAASLVWPMASLERIARDPDTLADEMRESHWCRRWQQQEFGASLKVALSDTIGRR